MNPPTAAFDGHKLLQPMPWVPPMGAYDGPRWAFIPRARPRSAAHCEHNIVNCLATTCWCLLLRLPPLNILRERVGLALIESRVDLPEVLLRLVSQLHHLNPQRRITCIRLNRAGLRCFGTHPSCSSTILSLPTAPPPQPKSEFGPRTWWWKSRPGLSQQFIVRDTITNLLLPFCVCLSIPLFSHSTFMYAM